MTATSLLLDQEPVTSLPDRLFAVWFPQFSVEAPQVELNRVLTDEQGLGDLRAGPKVDEGAQGPHLSNTERLKPFGYQSLREVLDQLQETLEVPDQ